MLPRMRAISGCDRIICLLWLVFATAHCSGEGSACPTSVACSGKGGACRVSSDCIGELECSGPNEPPVCGMPPRQECGSDGGCFGGEKCHAMPDLCSSTYVGADCKPPCGGDAECGASFRCNANRACEAIPCDEGFGCPAHQRCDVALAHSVGPVFTRAHGCVDIPCGTDSECPTGKFCTNSRCQDAPGKCLELMIVP
jgi:hypothetical protein